MNVPPALGDPTEQCLVVGEARRTQALVDDVDVGLCRHSKGCSPTAAHPSSGELSGAQSKLRRPSASGGST